MGARIELEVRDVARLIAAQLPEFAGLAVRRVEPGGWDHRTFRLGEELLVRVPSAARYAAQVEKEQRWLPALAPRLPLPIPAPVARGAPGPGVPWDWSIYRWLPGAPLDRGAPPAGLGKDLAGFLRALWAVDAVAVPGPAAGAHNFHRGGALAVYDAETEAALAALDGRVDADRARAVWAEALASQWGRAPVWVHGDVAPGNLLVRAGRLSAVIDFGCAGVGDPACDLVPAWTFLEGAARAAFVAGVEQDPATWARARGWALWKALIVLQAGGSGAPAAGRALARVLSRTAPGSRAPSSAW